MIVSDRRNRSDPFERLLGDIEAARRQGGEARAAPQWRRQPLAWTVPPPSDEDPGLDQEVRIPEDYDQPVPLRFYVLFEPDEDGVYDAQWVAHEGSRLQAGDDLIRAYRSSDGLPFVQQVEFPVRIVKRAVIRNRRLLRGDPVARCEISSLALDLEPFRSLVRDAQMVLAQAVNAAFKGLMSSQGQGGQIARRVVPVEMKLHPERGYREAIDEIVGALGADSVRLETGDVVVLSEKVVAIAQGRLFPLRHLYAHDPKMTDAEGRAELLEIVRPYVPDLTAADLIGADSLLDWPGEPMATAAVADPNGVAAELAAALAERLGVVCDVVIADTDTGLDVRETLIGAITIGATPIGATAGLVIYECMRVAAAAEFCRGASRSIPIVVCKPHVRRVRRESVGLHRGYAGRLNARRERLLGFA